MNEYRHTDTKRPDGCYVTFTRVDLDDTESDPRDYLFQDDDYRDADQKRLDAWRAGDWSFIGIQARADVLIVRNGNGTMYTFTSAGCYAIESDSGEDYLNSVFAEEKAALISDMEAMATPIVAE